MNLDDLEVPIKEACIWDTKLSDIDDNCRIRALLINEVVFGRRGDISTTRDGEDGTPGLKIAMKEDIVYGISIIVYNDGHTDIDTIECGVDRRIWWSDDTPFESPNRIRPTGKHTR